MKRKTVLRVLASLVVETAAAQEAKVNPLFSRELKESPGLEGLMMAVCWSKRQQHPAGKIPGVHGEG